MKTGRLVADLVVGYAAISCAVFAAINKFMFHPPRPSYGTDVPHLIQGAIHNTICDELPFPAFRQAFEERFPCPKLVGVAGEGLDRRLAVGRDAARGEDGGDRHDCDSRVK